MAKKFAELRAAMAPEARAEAKAQALLAALPDNELRQAHQPDSGTPGRRLPDR